MTNGSNVDSDLWFQDTTQTWFLSQGSSKLKLFCYYFFKILFIHERHREAEIQAEGEAGSPPGAWCGTQSQNPRIRTWAKGRCSITEPPRCLRFTLLFLFFKKDFYYLFLRDTERQAETQAEGEAGSTQEARCRYWSWDSRITPWAEGRR